MTVAVLLILFFVALLLEIVALLLEKGKIKIQERINIRYFKQLEQYHKDLLHREKTLTTPMATQILNDAMAQTLKGMNHEYFTDPENLGKAVAYAANELRNLMTKDKA